MGYAVEKIVQFPGPELAVIEGQKERGLTRFQQKIPHGVHPRDYAESERARRKEVEPFMNVGEVDAFIDFFLQRGRYRDALLAVFGCNTGLRISDILWMRWKDIYKTEDTFYDQIFTYTQKGAKRQQVVYNEAVKQAAQLYRANLNRPWCMDDWIFVSEGGRGCYTDLWDRMEDKAERKVQIERQPMLVTSVSHLMTKAAKDSGLFDGRRISTHSFRKTGLNAITGGVIGVEMDEELMQQVALVRAAQEMAGHSKAEITVNHYLTNNYRIAACIKMNLGLKAIEAYKKRGGIE